MNKEVIGYYQSNIKTSRNEDSVYAIKYASQQMLIDKLQQENNQLKEQKKELRSWLEERVFYLNSVFDRDIYEEQMMLDFSNILIKLNELEGGKNE